MFFGAGSTIEPSESIASGTPSGILTLLSTIVSPAGTIIRNSVAFDIDTIIFSNDSVSPYNEKVLRSTGGMIFNTNIIIGNIEEFISEIKNRNIKVIGTSLKSSISLEKLEKTREFAIIFGNEGNGVKDNILSLCDEIVRIDMNPKCESLNVGVSTAIILYYLYK